MTNATPQELVPEGGWCSPATPRLTAPAPNKRGPLFRSLSGMARLLGRAEVPDVITVLHINPRLFWAWLFFASRLMPFGRLPADLREKAILRTAWNCRSRYEWGQHVEIALRSGVTDSEIVAVTQGPEGFVDRHEHAVIAACDEIHHDRCVSDATWAVLAEKYPEKLLIELLMLIGHYQMIAAFLNSGGLKLEPPIEAKLQELHRRLQTH